MWNCPLGLRSTLVLKIGPFDMGFQPFRYLRISSLVGTHCHVSGFHDDPVAGSFCDGCSDEPAHAVTGVSTVTHEVPRSTAHATQILNRPRDGHEQIFIKRVVMEPLLSKQ